MSTWISLCDPAPDETMDWKTAVDLAILALEEKFQNLSRRDPHLAGRLYTAALVLEGRRDG
jgi:hypothetical protein